MKKWSISIIRIKKESDMGEQNVLTLKEIKKILDNVKDKRNEYVFENNTLVMKPRPSPKPEPKPEPRLEPRLGPRPKPNLKKDLLESLLDDLTAGILQRPKPKSKTKKMKKEISNKQQLTVQLKESFVNQKQPGPKLVITQAPKLRPPGTMSAQ